MQLAMECIIVRELLSKHDCNSYLQCIHSLTFV